MQSFRFPSVRDAQLTVGSAAAALLATLCWHVLVAVALFWWFLEEVPFHRTDLLTQLGWNWDLPRDVPRKNLALAGIAFVLVGSIAYVIWRAARFRQSAAASPRWFFLCWWQACLLGTLVIPAALLLSWWTFGTAAPGLLILAPYLLVAPAALSPRVLPTRQRWRPVCPECGHTVAYAVQPRCNECGEPYPCPDRYYRRWAIQRLPWELRRRTLAFAYIQTLFWIVFRPSRAAWRLAKPDRFGRAVRWTVGHTLIPAVLVLALILTVFFVATRIWSDPNATPLGVVPADQQSDGWIAWMVQWLLTWALVAVGYPVALGVALSAATPRVQPAARLGMIKWSLYAGAIPVCVLLVGLFGGLLLYALDALGIVRWTGGPWFSIFPYLLFESPVYILNALIGVYAVWWSIGVASQPCLRRRGFVVFVVALGAFVVLWRLTPLLFDLRGFEGLL